MPIALPSAIREQFIKTRVGEKLSLQNRKSSPRDATNPLFAPTPSAEKRLSGACAGKSTARGNAVIRPVIVAGRRSWVRTARAPATPKKNSKDSNTLAAAQRRGSHEICGPAQVIESECYARREWKSVVSPDGVQAWVTRLRKEPRNG
jgi:hypothetical protein